ncbi:MAG: hypothetical protein A3D24_04685 [Candidatus Blackburnbacteria bacterium RIFCSPHIGHO2_02_FULL_39_13]|uniref:Uncharacterized protein n=1 Tax=Candidatus Blackburnbacteria bacterium RIFCSPLOWO2_01_FULL_40_20 TaxID=1797519 RepID=A0A1G1VBM9_9BACT|nr:MAG: hypothetical protein UT38_C0007G0009 [Microgenomates group bacterium GW2011_GWA2_39_19]OGY07086.1 MAG: hypothetical protein A2694_03355 [Candidatus Blackburnbacteria bacterium RIFCSPHIGHO2_01_FULL_40_17]OGY08908.1 MAG: hypothetical protein A3D24_04685 [Candidatus Blackburnbacteria bacterium RIFCSPHIGHO2_02_FULL_39_13]OGY12746.1 MAG: hypothetical protein A3A77_00460 [Candidatus Blackburnbacteria bacterium RIFCSPLOWO2_01_FULL_40_20]OGY15274.1 MAG: hypothetical protein A3I52_01040 [Candida
MKNLILQSFRQGFALANKNWEVFLVGLIFYLTASINDLLGDSTISGFVEILVLLLLPVFLGFYLSMPFFLLQKQQGKLELSNILSTTLQNAKRLIIPSVLLFLVMVIFVVLFAIIASPQNIDFDAFIKDVNNVSMWKYLVPISLIGTFLSFTPIYFSIEKFGLLSSIKKSVGFSARHFNFVIPLAIFMLIYTLLPSEIVKRLPGVVGILLQSIVNNYQEIFFTAALLIFYQKATKVAK